MFVIFGCLFTSKVFTQQNGFTWNYSQRANTTKIGHVTSTEIKSIGLICHPPCSLLVAHFLAVVERSWPNDPEKNPRDSSSSSSPLPCLSDAEMSYVSFLDQVNFVGVQLVIRSIIKFFHYKKIWNTPQYSCIPTKFTCSSFSGGKLTGGSN